MASRRKRRSAPATRTPPVPPARQRSAAEQAEPTAPPAPAPAPAATLPKVTLICATTLLIALALIILDSAVYEQVRHNGFISLDDGLYVTENPNIQHGLTWAGAAWAFTSGYAANWHPLTWMSHMLDIQLYGLNAGGHHITSVILHVANTLLLFFGLFRLTNAPGRSAMVAALFGVHPVHVESVAWVAERKDVLSTFFWWLTIGAYVHHVQRPSARRFIWVLAGFALGLMAKPMLVTLPVVLLLIDVWPLERIRWTDRWETWVPLLREKAPMVVMAAVSTLITFIVQREGGAVIKLGKLPVGMRASNAILSYVRYLWKMTWPAHLNVFYTYPRAIPLEWTVAALALLAGLSFGAWKLSRKHPYVGVGWVWYLATLLPVIGLIQVGSQALADRYTYVPLVGIFVVVVWGIAEIGKRWSPNPNLLAVPGVAVVLALAMVARAQVATWKNSEAVWRHAIESMPENYVAYGALGSLVANEGKLSEAMPFFEGAVKANPDFPDAHYDLGIALARTNALDRAAAEFNEALRLKPDYAAAHENLARVLLRQGRNAEALAHLNEALRIGPETADLHTSVGVALFDQGQLEAALGHFTKAVRLNPNLASAHYRIAMVDARIGNTADALSEYHEAIRLQPDFPEAHNDLGFLLYALGKTDEAIAEYGQALQARPDFADALNNRGMAYGAEHKVKEAFDDFSRAVKLNPRLEGAHMGLGLVLAASNRFPEAKREFSEVLKLNPANESAKRALEQIARLGG